MMLWEILVVLLVAMMANLLVMLVPADWTRLLLHFFVGLSVGMPTGLWLMSTRASR